MQTASPRKLSPARAGYRFRPVENGSSTMYRNSYSAARLDLNWREPAGPNLSHTRESTANANGSRLTKVYGSKEPVQEKQRLAIFNDNDFV